MAYELFMVGLLAYELLTGDYLFAAATIIAILISFAPSVVEKLSDNPSL